jgi:hypothetical protein
MKACLGRHGSVAAFRNYGQKVVAAADKRRRTVEEKQVGVRG